MEIFSPQYVTCVIEEVFERHECFLWKWMPFFWCKSNILENVAASVVLLWYCQWGAKSEHHHQLGGTNSCVQYVHLRCWIKSKCVNCAWKWEIQRFDGELFIHTCMTSPAKRADVACRVKPEGRRPDPLFNIPKDCNCSTKSQNMDFDLFHTYW